MTFSLLYIGVTVRAHNQQCEYIREFFDKYSMPTPKYQIKKDKKIELR